MCGCVGVWVRTRVLSRLRGVLPLAHVALDEAMPQKAHTHHTFGTRTLRSCPTHEANEVPVGKWADASDEDEEDRLRPVEAPRLVWFASARSLLRFAPPSSPP